MTRPVAACLFASLLAPPAAHGQPKTPPPPPPPPPQFPTLTTPANLGVRAGEPAELTLTGTNLADAVAVVVSRDAVSAKILDAAKDGTRLTVRFDIPAKFKWPIGLFQLRVVTKHGVSNFRPLCVDDLPEVKEKDGNSKKESAQPVPVPCVVSGTAAAEASDFYRLAVKAGQRVTVEVLGRRIGSPIDPVIILHDAKTGRELPGLYADDTPGLQTDARLTHTFPADADVLVEVRDTTYRGGADFVYRLRVGDFPGATTAFPLAVDSSTLHKPPTVGFAGPGLDGVLGRFTRGHSAAGAFPQTATPFHPDGLPGWPVPVPLSPFPEAVEAEPNDDPKAAARVPVPGGVSARFDKKGDLDHFAFAAKKGQKYVVSAEAWEHNAPTELYFRLLDAKGKELAKSDPQKAAARVEFAAPADGDCVVACEHLNYLYGPNEVYHLVVKPAAPDFEVTLGLDRFAAAVGETTAVPVIGVARLNGFAGPITLRPAGPPGNDPTFAGELVVRPGDNPSTQQPLYLAVTPKAGNTAGRYDFAVLAAATIDGQEVRRPAVVTDLVKAGLAALPNPPPDMLDRLAFAVTPPAPFTLELVLDKPEAAQGATVKGKVVVKRSEGFDGEVKVEPLAAPANLAVKPKPVAKGKAEAEVEVAADGKAAVGPGVVILKGTAKVGGKDYAVTSKPAAVTVVEGKKAEPKKKDEPKKKQ